MKKITWILPLLALTIFSSTNLYSVKRAFIAEEVAQIMDYEKAKINLEQLKQTLENQGITLKVRKPSGWNSILCFVCNVAKIVGIVEIFSSLIENSPDMFIEGIVTICGAQFVYRLFKEDDTTVFLDWYPIY